MIQKHDYTFNLLLLGDSSVGKTSLIHRFTHQLPYEKYPFLQYSVIPTVGFNIESRVVEIDGKKVKLLLNDTAGQERFRSIARSFYKKADAIVLVYDISDRQSLANLNQWLVDVDTHTQKDIPKMLLANKCDLQAARRVTFIDGSNYAQFLKIPFFQTSAMNGNNVQQAFVTIATLLKERKDKHSNLKVKQSADAIKIEVRPSAKSSGGGCPC